MRGVGAHSACGVFDVLPEEVRHKCRRRVRHIAMLVLLGCCTVAAAQAPLEAVLEGYQAELEESLARDDFEAAMGVMRTTTGGSAETPGRPA